MNKYELYHYGVKGQKWGVRRYQNADGSLTTAGKKRLAKDIRNHFNKDRDWDTERRLADKNPIINKAHLSDTLSESRKKLNKLSEMMRDYDESDDIQFEYKKKALVKFGMETEESVKQYSKKDMWLMYEDWDQGDYGSVDLYLRDKGSSLGDYAHKVDTALNEYRSVCKDYTNSVLDKYGNTIVKRRYSWEGRTANEAMVDALVSKADEDNRLVYRYS
jgi:hypothetical protein